MKRKCGSSGTTEALAGYKSGCSRTHQSCPLRPRTVRLQMIPLIFDKMRKQRLANYTMSISKQRHTFVLHEGQQGRKRSSYGCSDQTCGGDDCHVRCACCSQQRKDPHSAPGGVRWRLKAAPVPPCWTAASAPSRCH